MTEANLQTEWAALLFKSLADAGVRDIVISPTSSDRARTAGWSVPGAAHTWRSAENS